MSITPWPPPYSKSQVFWNILVPQILTLIGSATFQNMQWGLNMILSLDFLLEVDGVGCVKAKIVDMRAILSRLLVYPWLPSRAAGIWRQTASCLLTEPGGALSLLCLIVSIWLNLPSGSSRFFFMKVKLPGSVTCQSWIMQWFSITVLHFWRPITTIYFSLKHC